MGRRPVLSEEALLHASYALHRAAHAVVADRLGVRYRIDGNGEESVSDGPPGSLAVALAAGSAYDRLAGSVLAGTASEKDEASLDELEADGVDVASAREIADEFVVLLRREIEDAAPRFL
jgi:hypothetical protein